MNAFTRVRLREKMWTGMEVCVQFNACIVQQHHVEVRLSSRLFLDRHSRSTEVCFLVSSEDQEQNVHWVCGNDDCGLPSCCFVFRQTQNIWLIFVSPLVCFVIFARFCECTVLRKDFHSKDSWLLFFLNRNWNARLTWTWAGKLWLTPMLPPSVFGKREWELVVWGLSAK